MIEYRNSSRNDESALTKMLVSKQFCKYVGNHSNASLLLAFGDGYVVKRNDKVKGVLQFTPWYCLDGVKSTMEARITLFIVDKEEDRLRQTLLDVYHRGLQQNQYVVSYADVAADNCFGMDILTNNGYRVSEELKNVKDTRIGYTLYRSL